MGDQKLKIPVIIDTDPGIDDTAAIMWMLASEKYDVKALTTTHGNVGLEGCTKNALRVLTAAGRRDIPVYRGSPEPLMRDKINASYYHGQDGLGNTYLPEAETQPAEGCAAAKIVEIAKAAPMPITILAIGPITNVALAILLEPELKNYVSQIVFMGGAVRVSGNTTPVASFNVVADPEAARIVYRSGIPVVQVGLDICNRFRFHEEDFRMLSRHSSPCSDLLTGIFGYRQQQLVENNCVEEGIALNDVPAAAYLINPDWFRTKLVHGDVETCGSCIGQTVLDVDNRLKHTGPGNVVFCESVDSRSAINGWIEDVAKLLDGLNAGGK